MHDKNSNFVSGESLKLTMPKAPPAISFYGQGREVFRIQFEPELKVILAEGCTWDDAAKSFWNGVHLVMGLPEPFPKKDDDDA